MENTKRINAIGAWLKEEFGQKIIKLSIDGGFTCPNRDGRVGVGGCIFCSSEGSGELASDIPGQMKLLSEKWPNATAYLAYFQSHTSTYAPVEVLRKQYEEALAAPGVVGIAIATRPDCLPPEVLDLLSELNEKTFLWVELGLQTIHEDRINRCYPLSVYDQAISDLTARGIKVVTHLILGLPGETKEDMHASLRYICQAPIFGLKLHLMNVVKGSPLETLYPGYTPFDSPEEYIQLVCDLLMEIPPEITIHRLTGDVMRKLLVSPQWSYKKRTILNGIAQEMKRRDAGLLSSGPSLPSL
ncbi:MAG: TIGR01212 family radical SAM protein [Anaerovoracaceae bacterium]